MPDIFLSYASEDRERAKALAEALQGRGHQVWWDRGLAAGDDYARVIGAALEQAKVVIVLWTPAASASVWVRDEAARARDAGKLLPVMMEQTAIPLGFGAIQAEDFTRWNGGADAAQMQLLSEAVKARLEGRAVDSGAVADKRARLMKRIRLVSILSVAAAVVGIGAGVSTIMNNHRQANQPPVTAPVGIAEQLLQLVRDGTITPEQAVELARVLEGRTFEGTIAAGGQGPQPPSLDLAMASAAAVDDSEVGSLARGLFRVNLEPLMRSPNPEVRTAALGLTDPTTRDASFNTLWQIASAGAPEAATIWRLCGAVGYATGNPRGVEALERARLADPSSFEVWRLLGHAYAGQQRTGDAQGAALVGAGLAAQEAQAPEQATQRLEEALPQLEDPLARTFVQGTLGEVALQQGNLDVAAERFREALAVAPPVTMELSPEANEAVEEASQEVRGRLRERYAITLDRGGRTREACRELRTAVRENAVLADVEPEMLRRCEIELPASPEQGRAAVDQPNAASSPAP
jgi:tetratricopeptide (TPR) repeat protein